MEDRKVNVVLILVGTLLSALDDLPQESTHDHYA
jgi:hypothetical protein